MELNLPLDKMSTIDKIRVMETLWEDLCRNAGDFASPSWHGEVLKARQKNLDAGTEKITDWEEAKKDIRKTVL